MFWKHARLNPIPSWSLVKKLMFLYSLSTLAILFAVALFLYPTFNKLLSTQPVTNITQSIDDTNRLKHKQLSIECFKQSILALLLASLGALGLGNIVARNGLKKVDHFAILMARISASALNERVDPEHWPKELKVLGKTFNSMLERLQTSFEQLKQFSSDLAHELRTPLHNLQILTEVELGKQPPEAYRDTLESYLDEFNYLKKLIENLLFIARSENGVLALNHQSFLLKTEITKMSEYYYAIIEEKKIEFNIHGDDVAIQADPILLKRALCNIFSNAFRYTPAQGKIMCNIVKLPGGEVEICIQDNGIGISEQHLSKIFDRFYRVDFARNLQSGGLGLGLAIVKSILELHHGSIVIHSQPNEGTKVILNLPG